VASWQWFGRLHTRVYRATRGVVGGSLAGMPMLLLTTTGRRSGEPRTSPLPYLEVDSSFVVVGSNNGGPRDPAWWLNLSANPMARIETRAGAFEVEAALATGEARALLWPKLKEFNPAYRRYEKMTDREIPVVVLRRSFPSPSTENPVDAGHGPSL
jgi:deazaflavin-dependent oxidoreductase (nitroreductase family)